MRRRVLLARGGALLHGRPAGVLGLLACALSVCALLCSLGGPAAAQARAGGFRVQRVCHAAPPGRAACLGLKLVPASLSAAELHANAVKQSREAGAGARPAVTVSEPYPGYLTPQRLHDAYALPSETSASHVQTVAIVDAYDDPTAEADLDVYDKQFGLPACTSANGCFRKVNQSGKPSPLPKKQGEWAAEISIDVQMVRAVCQSCRILLVEASSDEFGDLAVAVDSAVAAGADEVSNSYGGAEQHSYASLASNYYDHPGTAIVASSGDCGYLNKTCTGEPAAAEFPAAAPQVLAVGGTSLSEHNQAWSATAWNEGGSGCSGVFGASSWQSAVAGFSATGCAGGRSVADVAAIGDPNTGVDVYDSTPEGGGTPTGWGVWGGTSVAAPILAAEFALAGGARGVAYPSATLYSHLGEANSLYDVLSGSNGSCAGTSECQAVAGFDGPTGLGSPLGLGAFSIAGTPVSTSPPTISGFAEQGQKLTAGHGAWSNASSSSSEQWARCNAAGYGCAPIAGATGSSYVLTAADVAATIRLQETAVDAAGESAPAASAQTAPVAADVPTITGFSPSSGITGSAFTIEGTALASVSAVKLGKLPAAFTVLSPTRIEAVVPSGAKPGKVAISTPGGSAKSKSKFTPTLSLTGFSPGHGVAGRVVTVKGVGFTPSSGVTFAGTPAGEVTFFSSRKLKAVVPAGAAAGPIAVSNTTAPAGTALSAADFKIP